MTGPRPLTVCHRIDVLDRFLNRGYRVPLQVEVRAGSEDPAGAQVAVRWFELISTRQKVRVVTNGQVRGLGPLQAFAPEKPVPPNDPVDADIRHAQRMSLHALTGREMAASAPSHAITGEDPSSHGGISIQVSIDGKVRGIDAERYECHRLDEVVGEIRAAAAGIFHRENEGWFVPKELPVWIVSPDYSGPQSWRVEVREPSHVDAPERIFGLERLEAARDFCRWMNQGVDGIVVGRILELGSALPEKEPISHLAQAASIHLRQRNPKVLDLPASLIRDWHAVTNGEAILVDEGRSGAVRILSGFMRLAEHLSLEGRDLGEWAPLLWRIEQEGLVSKPSPADPRP